jgi:hypothetical protein
MMNYRRVVRWSAGVSPAGVAAWRVLSKARCEFGLYADWLIWLFTPALI